MGCVRSEAGSAVATRDSSGVEIVSNTPGEENSGCILVDSIPVVTIGGADGEGPYELFRALRARRLRDGGIVILNAGTHGLRVFDSTGRFVRSIGKQGSGPGEFQRPSMLALFGRDSMMVYDSESNRLSLFGLDGSLLNTIGVRIQFGSFQGRLSDGSLLFSISQAYSPGAPSGIGRDTVRLLRASSEGEPLDTIGMFPGFESVVEGTASSVWVTGRPFGRSTLFNVGGGQVYVGDNAEYRVRAYSEDGQLIRIVEMSRDPVPVTDADVARARGTRPAGGDPRAQERMDRLYRPENLAETKPAFSALRLDPAGWLWVRPSTPAGDTIPRWDVFDASGRFACQVSLPVGLVVFEVGSDYLLGMVRDEDEVEQVRLYGLTRQ